MAFIAASKDNLTKAVSLLLPKADFTVAKLGGTGTAGRALAAAETNADARAAIGAGTSNLKVGTASTDAKPGNYSPVTSDISDMSAAGRSVAKMAAPTTGPKFVQINTDGTSSLVDPPTSSGSTAGSGNVLYDPITGRPYIEV